jgi:hypothetical protein
MPLEAQGRKGVHVAMFYHSNERLVGTLQFIARNSVADWRNTKVFLFTN